MEDDKIVVDDTLNVSKAPEGETPEQELVRLRKIAESNPKLYERTKAAEALVKELKSKILPTPEKPKIDDELVTDIKELKQIEKKRQFGYKNKLSPEETDLLFRFAGTTDPNESLKDQDFKDLLDARRRRERVANAIPSSSNRSTSVEGKSFKEMTPEERAKNWDKMIPK